MCVSQDASVCFRRKSRAGFSISDRVSRVAVNPFGCKIKGHSRKKEMLKLNTSRTVAVLARLRCFSSISQTGVKTKTLVWCFALASTATRKWKHWADRKILVSTNMTMRNEN